MALEQIDCPLIAEIAVDFSAPFLVLDGISLYDIFTASGGTGIGKQSGDPIGAPGTRLWYSDSVQRYTLLFSTADPAPFMTTSLFGVDNGIAVRPYNLVLNGGGTLIESVQFTAIGVPENAGVVLDPDPVSPLQFNLDVPVPSSFNSDYNGSPFLPGGWLGPILVDGSNNALFASINFSTENGGPIANVSSAFTVVDADENSIFDNVQSYTIANQVFIFYPYYNPAEDSNIYPRIKVSQPGPYPGAALYDQTFQLKLQFLNDRLQGSYGDMTPCQNTGMFGFTGNVMAGPPYYLYGVKFDGSGYYRYSLNSSDTALLADIAAFNFKAIIHTDGIYLFEDRGGLGTSLWIYRFPFSSLKVIQNYQPIKLPCEINCVPLFDLRKY